MDTNTAAAVVELPYKSVWRHKRKPLTLVVNVVWRDRGEIQVLTDDREHLKWLSIKGFTRDYEPTGQFETSDGHTVDSLDDA
ncbi:hypothetical protein [Curtobacterium sp. MCSS17_016]|uniref:hypothetical protein n=1 Tax=Curtobacterium sp. MCSS17_016 TaxID=2175644 RepID=UPI000DA7B69E|nr:hypothetical protein [Curtobacterium sp. MCSS17_016]WIE81315.1 hypothetical protein DEJ19_018960 [Curtobacterium sp. MCSS17_016]